MSFAPVRFARTLKISTVNIVKNLEFVLVKFLLLTKNFTKSTKSDSTVEFVNAHVSA